MGGGVVVFFFFFFVVPIHHVQAQDLVPLQF